MLFNSYTFIVLFLPFTLAGFYSLLRFKNPIWAIGFLTCQSLIFYAWWDVRNLPILLGSIAMNYTIASLMTKTGNHKKPLLALGVVSNLSLLGYFKYIGFFTVTLQSGGFGVPLLSLALPLGISFFTFQQIAFLIGIYEGKDRVPNIIRYAAFVTFFPHLIAGPILHHKEIQPQFGELGREIPWDHIWAGIALFSIGLFKKVIIADSLGMFADPLYAKALAGTSLSFAEGWMAAFLYGLQIYFDFSGYSDMALGLAHLFGITLPRNFASPYKATSIIDLWQRWHMTLTRFMVSYLYNPLALWITRKRAAKGKSLSTNLKKAPASFLSIVIFPTVMTMTVLGIWHGSSIQFLFFGLLHGTYLSINRAWRSLGYALPPITGRTLTIISFMVSMVLFRAPSVDVAMHIYSAMANLPTLLHIAPFLEDKKALLKALGWVVASMSLALTLPNAVSWVREGEPALRLKFSTGTACFFVVLALFLFSFVKISTFSVFLYFNF